MNVALSVGCQKRILSSRAIRQPCVRLGKTKDSPAIKIKYYLRGVEISIRRISTNDSSETFEEVQKV
jgi:hypothetical protein